ncbi:MAG: ABC transporter substrate-binding protein [Gemmatimonadales bacterium]|nr:ABC transporter substrate-binding protein [Gemmatimonadales bacterium]
MTLPLVLRHPLILLCCAVSTGCGSTAGDRGATVLYASGADLQSINPLLTVHPMARQVQRYILLTTLARYDSALVPEPYLARSWQWSADRRSLTFIIRTTLRWHDGVATTARDVAFTLDAARSPDTGYPRLNDLRDIASVVASSDSTLVVTFGSPPHAFPDVLTDLAIIPRHLLDTVPLARLRQAAWNEHPVGNGPFRFVAHEPNRRWVFAANPDFPAELGGRPRLDRFIVVVVDEPTTKLAALTSGELDVAGIQPAHASFVRRNPALAVMSYPLNFTYALVFNTRRPPFDDIRLRRAASAAVDRQEIVDGYLYGFGTPAFGPVPPDVPGYLAPSPPSDASNPARHSVAFEMLTVGSGEAALEQMIQARLSTVRLDARIRQLELGAFLDRAYGPRHDFAAAVIGVPGDAGLGYLAPLLSLAGMAPPADAVAAQRLFQDSMPAAFLYHARGLQGISRRLHGVRMDLRGEMPTVHDWWVTPSNDR